MDDKTVKTGSGGASGRFTKRKLLYAGIAIGVILIAGGAGVGLRMVQNNRDDGAGKGTGQSETEGPTLPKAVMDAQDLRMQGNAADADKAIDSALSDTKTSSDDKYLLYIQKGAGFFDQQKFAEAATAFGQAASVKQTSEAYTLLGDAYAAGGQKDKAIEAYKKAIAAMPSGPLQDDEREVLEAKIKNAGGSV